MKILNLIFILLYLHTSVFAQSKKEIRENKITSETVYNTKSADSKEIKDSYTAYDKNGNAIEKIDYNKDGAIKTTEKHTYSANKNKIEETVYDATGKLISKTSYIYNTNDEKIGEIDYDGSGNILKQSYTTYDAKGFKVEKKIFDGNKKLISVKKYVYTKR
ncbi:MAG: hypothetical protein HXX18_10395 [Bacteroidetes bacterium]|nr:hypothetical protein [Bacteroidota bacterium]